VIVRFPQSLSPGGRFSPKTCRPLIFYPHLLFPLPKAALDA